MLYLLSTSCVLTLASSLLFPLGYATAAQFLLRRGSSLRASRSTRTSRRSSPSRRPCGALLSFGEFYSYFVLRFHCIRHFVINVINNIRIRFIMFFSRYVLWYTVHSIVYTCDLILARIWLLGLCPFINRVLHKLDHVGSSCSYHGDVVPSFTTIYWFIIVQATRLVHKYNYEPCKDIMINKTKSNHRKGR